MLHGAVSESESRLNMILQFPTSLIYYRESKWSSFQQDIRPSCQN